MFIFLHQTTYDSLCTEDKEVNVQRSITIGLDCLTSSQDDELPLPPASPDLQDLRQLPGDLLE